MRVSLSDEAPPCLLVLAAPATKGGEKWRNAPKGHCASSISVVRKNSWVFVLGAGIEPPDRLAQLLRIVDTRTDTIPESLCVCKHFRKPHLAPLIPLASSSRFQLFPTHCYFSSSFVGEAS